MNQKQLTPSLRFPEYTDIWTTSRMGDIGEFKNGLNKGAEDFGFGKPFINLLDVFGKTEIDKPTLQCVNVTKKEIDNYNIFSGDVFFVRSSVKREGVGETVVCNYDLPETVYSGFLIRFRSNEGLNNSFKKYCFRTSNFRNSLIRMSTSSANTNINQDSLQRLIINKPSLDEQKKIAEFLSAIDKKINHLKKKHTLLQQYKKGLMQQLFSQQIRFKDDNGNAFPDWQDKKIGNFMTESRIKGNSGDVAQKITVKLWGKGVFKKDRKCGGSENTQYYIRKAGQFIYSKLDFLNCAFGIIPNELDGFESTVDLPCFDVTPEVNHCFILELIKQKTFYKKYGDMADGSRKAKRIHAASFLNFPAKIPTIEEQKKIAVFLDVLNQKISQVTEQIEQTEKFKKGLLQQMFV